MPAQICIHPWKFRVEPFRIFGNLYYVGNRGVSSHLLDTGDGLVLIDTGYPQTLYLLLESIRRLGYDPDDIRIILNTHAHYDHIGGTRALSELTGAAVCIGRDDVEIAASRPELTEADLAGMTFEETFQADRALEDGDRVVLGSTSVQCIHTPGHTPGTMSFCVEVSDGQNAFLAGLHGGPGTATLKDEYLAEHGLPASLRADYLKSLDVLRQQPVQTHLGAHPSQSRTFAKRDLLDENALAFVDPASWPAYLDRLEESFHKRFG